jgi:trimeric autotransporter adhesin
MMTVLLLITLGAGCGYSSKSTPPQAGVMPKISGLSPDSASAGSAVMLTVNGSGFNTNAVVNWNGAAQTTTYVNGSQLTATIAAATDNMPGMFSVTVTNPGTPPGQYGGGTSAETSNPMSFTVK